jgi:thiol-disulfide isomerase/thioredoxin
MKENIFLIIFCSFFHLTYSQKSTVTIIGKIPQTSDNITVTFRKPIGSYPSSYYMDVNDSCTLKNGFFKATIALQESGIISAFQKPPNEFSFCSFYASPSDTIYFIINDSNEIIMSGKNSDGNNLYSNRHLLGSGKPDGDKIIGIFQQNKRPDSTFNNLQLKLKEYTGLLDDLYSSKKITEDCYKTLLAETEQQFYFWVSSTLQGCEDEAYKKQMNITLSSAELKQLVNLLNEYYSPFYPKYKKSSFLTGNIFTACGFIEYFDTAKSVQRVWNKFDDVFKNTMTNFGVIDFSPVEEYKAVYVADAIFTAKRFQTATTAELVPIFNALQEKYPASPYIIPIQKTFLAELMAPVSVNDNKELANTNPNGKLLAYNLLTGLSETPIPNIENLTSFTSLLKQTFPNQPVFIDSWATYCAPCKVQFKYADALHKFLEVNKIPILYVGIDEDGGAKLWKTNISDYKLEGYHLFAGAKFRKDVMNIIKYVPKYYLYNSKGKLVEIKSKPSEKGKMFAEIKSKL